MRLKRAGWCSKRYWATWATFSPWVERCWVAGLGARSGVADVEAGDVPGLDDAAKLGDEAVLFELAEAFDGEDAGVVHRVRGADGVDAVLRVLVFIGDGGAPAAGEVDEVPGRAVGVVAEDEELAVDDGAAFVGGDVEAVGGEAAAALAEGDGDGDGAVFAAGDELAEVAGGLARAVGAHDDGEAGEGEEARVAEEAVVGEVEGF